MIAFRDFKKEPLYDCNYAVYNIPASHLPLPQVSFFGSLVSSLSSLPIPISVFSLGYLLLELFLFSTLDSISVLMCTNFISRGPSVPRPVGFRAMVLTAFRFGLRSLQCVFRCFAPMAH